MSADLLSRPAAPVNAIGIRYEIIEPLGKGAMGIVYRAVDRLMGQEVALKRVATPAEQLWFSSRFDVTSNYSASSADVRLALAYEFQMMASLRHPNIIGVLDYGFDVERTPYFTMEVVEQSVTIRDAAAALPRDGKVHLLIQMLQALAYLHRRGIIHRDLKPGNVLVNLQNDEQVKVLDFGLSVAGNQATAPSGTLAYMAPELLNEQSASIRSDLYAVGVIAYELFIGRHPFDTETITRLVDQVIGQAPDLSSPELDPALRPILERLLAKDPLQRYASADEVIAALSQAIGQTVPAETEAIRESFLQAAQLVGRDAELGTLSTAVMDTLGGTGSAWLVGGESGVGKSRLLEEVRVRALVRGALVLRGQSISDGGSPFQLWLDSLRWLALLTLPDTIEASILKPVVPDIETLLGRSVPDAPSLTPAAARVRLLTTITEIIGRQTQPIVIILEDLHWASAESLELLKWLLRLERPLMIIGSYRDDETPNLPADLPSMQVMKLDRLSSENIAELSASMLGEAGRDPKVIDFLQRETEGNVFFLVEVVRSLAEEAGQLDRIADITLPANLITGGVQRIVQRRLNRVQENNRPLLEIAAVAGRHLDLALLHRVNGTVDMDRWLMECAGAAVLDVFEDRWRFAHDKLREGLITGIDAQHRKALHERLALAIEQMYPNTVSQAAALAYHWGKAGNTAKEGHYAGIAGEEALRTGANQEATTYLTKALESDPQTQLDADTRSKFPPLNSTQFKRAVRLRQLGEAYYGLGNLGMARDMLEQSLALLGYPIIQDKRKLILGILGQVGRQLFTRTSPNLFVGRSKKTRHILLEASRNHSLFGEICYFAMEITLGINSAITALNLSEQAGASPELARCYIDMAIVAGLIPIRGLAENYASAALRVSAESDNVGEHMVIMNLAAVYNVGTAQWSKASDLLEQVTQHADSLQDRRQWIMAQATRAILMHALGQFPAAAELNEITYRAASQTGNVQQQGWGLYSQGEDFNRMGRWSEAVPLFEKMIPLLANDIRRGAQFRTYASLAVSKLHLGDYKEARLYADKSADLSLGSKPSIYSGIEAYSGLCEVYIALLQQSRTAPEPDDPDVLRLAQASTKQMMTYAKLHPMGQARAYYWQGKLNQLLGKPDDAIKAWRRGLAAADQYGMPYDEGLNRLMLGLHVPTSDPERIEYLKCAVEMFTECHATYDLQRAQEALRRA